MSTELWKVTDTKSFGNYKLVEFLLDNGACYVEKTGIDVTVGAFKAALDHAPELDLAEKDIAFIQKEIEESRLDGFAEDDDDEDESVDVYEIS